MKESIEKYVQLCEDEARELTGLEFSAADDHGRPSLNFHFREGKGWTYGEPMPNRTLFSVGRLH